MDGFLLIDKPVGIFSTDVVNHYHKVYKTKIGHAGTLDPFASGLIVILFGNATKLSWLVHEMEKEYIGEIRLGVVTDSYDKTGRVIKETNTENITTSRVKKIMRNFVGEIDQTPPPFSAVKVKGERSYKLARSGVIVKKKPRKIRVYDFRLIKFEHLCISFRALVGKGCYMRSLAHDLGRDLECGATLWALKRTRIGDLKLVDAGKMDDDLRLHPVDEILSFLNRIDVDSEKMDMLINGSSIEYQIKDGEELVYVTDGKRKAVGLCKDNKLKTKRVIVG